MKTRLRFTSKLLRKILSFRQVQGTKFLRALIFALILVFAILLTFFHRGEDLSTSSFYLNESLLNTPIFRIDQIPNIEHVFSSVGKTDQSNFNLENPRSEIQAAILPHHTDIGQKIDEFWSEISLRSSPEIIVLVSPAHLDQGNANVQTTNGIWKTPFGNVQTDSRTIKDLNISLEPESFVNEQGIATHMPFIANYFPDVPVVPVIAPSRSGITDADAFVRKLLSLDKKILLISSIDFSHYLSAEISDANDLETQEAIADRNFDRIDRMGSDYLDSSFALDTFLFWKGYSGCLAQPRWHEHNSRLMSGIGSKDGTSYLVYYCSKRPLARISAVGDIMLARGIGKRLNYQNINKNIISDLKKVDVLMKSVTGDSDLLFGNLESVLSDIGKPVQKEYVFSAEPRLVDLFTQWRFSHLSVANNHSFDYGREAWEQSVGVLRTKGIVPVGGYSNETNIETVTAGGQEFAFLGFENLVKPFNKKDVLSAITVAAKSHDVVVVSMHWGEEYQPEPDLLTVELAREMIDAGADIIFGHHPHVLQPVERYKDGLIFYSLGNFIFDQFGEAQNTSMIATVDVFEDGELDYSTTPVLIDEGFPVLK